MVPPRQMDPRAFNSLRTAKLCTPATEEIVLRPNQGCDETLRNTPSVTLQHTYLFCVHWRPNKLGRGIAHSRQ
jgi:hypothetical protein